jgi:hypothetical protein
MTLLAVIAITIAAYNTGRLAERHWHHTDELAKENA